MSAGTMPAANLGSPHRLTCQAVGILKSWPPSIIKAAIQYRFHERSRRSDSILSPLNMIPLSQTGEFMYDVFLADIHCSL